jgi:hypothetical protein
MGAATIVPKIAEEAATTGLPAFAGQSWRLAVLQVIFGRGPLTERARGSKRSRSRVAIFARSDNENRDVLRRDRPAFHLETAVVSPENERQMLGKVLGDLAGPAVKHLSKRNPALESAEIAPRRSPVRVRLAP